MIQKSENMEDSVNFAILKTKDPEIFEIIKNEKKRQLNHLQLIASENYASPAVMAAQATVLTNKYAEGYPGHRYYEGCQWVDRIEEIARERMKKLFQSTHANVQPHSGSQANMAVYFTLLEPGDKIMAMNLAHGGHLTHGSEVNFSGKFYNIIPYGVRRTDHLIDMDALAVKAREHRPKLVVAGATAYARHIDFATFRQIADDVGAYLMVDAAHIAGLIAGGIYPSPIQYAHVVTGTTHKTLRGPRGGFILGIKSNASALDKTVFPGIQGGPLMHVIAAKAVAAGEALSPKFREYAQRIVDNARAMGDEFLKQGISLVSGGTDSHLILVDLTGMKLTGKDAAERLQSLGITANKNAVPFDSRKPYYTSGIRFGTPALTTRGMKEDDMRLIAQLVTRVLREPDTTEVLEDVRAQVADLTSQFPLFAW